MLVRQVILIEYQIVSLNISPKPETLTPNATRRGPRRSGRPVAPWPSCSTPGLSGWPLLSKQWQSFLNHAFTTEKLPACLNAAQARSHTQWA